MVALSAILHLSADYQVIASDGDLKRVAGLDAVQLVAVDNALLAALHPADHVVLERMGEKLRDGDSAEGDLRIRDQTGRYRVLVCELRPNGGDESNESLANPHPGFLLTLTDARTLKSQLDPFPSAMITMIMESTDDFIFFKDMHHILLIASQSMTALCEPVDHWLEFAGKNDYDVFPEDLADNYYELETRVYSTGALAHEIQPILSQDGCPGWVDNRKYPIRDGSGKMIGLYGVARDITEQINAMHGQALAASVFDNAAESIAILNRDGDIVNVNRAFVDSTGFEKSELLGASPRDSKHSLDRIHDYEKRWAELMAHGAWQGELESTDASGEKRVELARFSAVHDASGAMTHVVCMYSDITTIKRHEQELEAIAHYDLLTGLANRSLFDDRLHQAIASSARRGTYLAIAYIDIDSFKQVNDRLGHDAGDRYLSTIAGRMKTALRDADTLARFGGDEFVALITDLDDDLKFRTVVNRLLSAAASSVDIDGNGISCSASIGISRYPQDGIEGDLLMRRADQAMYTAKQRGKNQAYIFERGDLFGMEVRKDILNGMNEDKFRLVYQPKVHMGNGELLGVEALIRWDHPTRGLLSPLEFLPLVDRENLTIELGNWVVDKALRQLEAWHKEGMELSVSINVAGMQLQQSGFLEELSSRLAAMGLDNGAPMEIEILESSALHDLPAISSRIGQGRALGLQFALDDFGTGFSSLTHLRQLAVESVKVDASFVRDMLEDPDDHAIVSSIIGLCDGLNRRCIAEGVSSASHARALLAMGCEYGQGYAIARPMEADHLADWLADWQRSQAWLRFGDGDAEGEPQRLASQT